MKRIREAQWRQGSIVSSKSLPHLAAILGGSNRIQVSESDWWIVVTHDCDLLNDDLRKEPWVEVLVARPAGKSGTSPHLRHGRNPRRIQFEGRVGDSPVQLLASIHDRWRLPRGEFARMGPDPRRRLAPGVLRILCQWLAKRYVRSGFPDAFNARLQGVRSQFQRFLKAHDPHLKAVYVALDPGEEIPAGEKYRCAVALVYPAEWNDPDAREMMEKELHAVLSPCPGIDLVDVNAWSTEEFTLADMEAMLRMDFDFLSYDEDDPVLPPETVDLA